MSCLPTRSFGVVFVHTSLGVCLLLCFDLAPCLARLNCVSSLHLANEMYPYHMQPVHEYIALTKT